MSRTKVVHLASLHNHHRWFMMYGVCQAGTAMISTSFLWANQARLALSLPNHGEILRHPLWVVLFVPFVLTSAMVYLLAAVVRAKFWLRTVMVTIVMALLLYLGWSVGALAYTAVPALLAALYVFWRGARPSTQHPAVRDIMILSGLVLGAWLLSIVFGVRMETGGPLGTLYLGIAQVIAVAAFLPGLLLLLAGLDVAELFDVLSGRLSKAVTHFGHRAAIVSLLFFSIVKLGFYSWKSMPPLDSGLIAAVVFIGIVAWMMRRTPEEAADFEPRFTHWLALAAFLLGALVLGSVAIDIVNGTRAMSGAGNIMMATVGPLWIVLACLLRFRSRMHPLMWFASLAGCWATLSIGLQPLTHWLFGLNWPGLTLRDLDFISAILFLCWSSWLLIKKTTSANSELWLKVSLFLSCGFILNELLAHQIAIAEWYGLFQAVTFLAMHYLPSHRGRIWFGVVMVLAVIGFIAMSLTHNVMAAWVGQLLANGVIAGAIIWDLLVSESRMTGEEEPNRDSFSRPARLFLYLGFTTWAAAQFVFARTGEGADAASLEPMMSLGFVLFGMPTMFFSLIRQFRGNEGTLEVPTVDSEPAIAIQD